MMTTTTTTKTTIMICCFYMISINISLNLSYEKCISAGL